MTIQTSISSTSERFTHSSRLPTASDTHDTGFTVSVTLRGANAASNMVEMTQAAQVLSELTQEWFPQAEVQAVLKSSHQPSFPAPQRPSIYDRLPASPAEPQTIVVGTADVTIDGTPLNLSPQELNLFRCLAVRRDEVVTREHIQTCAWEHHTVHSNSRTIDVHVRRLREKTQIPGLFSTVRGKGYRLNSAAATIIVEPRQQAN